MVIGGNRWKSVFEVVSGNKSNVSVVYLDDFIFFSIRCLQIVDGAKQMCHSEQNHKCHVILCDKMQNSFKNMLTINWIE